MRKTDLRGKTPPFPASGASFTCGGTASWRQVQPSGSYAQADNGGVRAEVVQDPVTGKWSGWLDWMRVPSNAGEYIFTGVPDGTSVSVQYGAAPPGSSSFTQTVTPV
ncbi:MAG: hypothetical protein R3B70_48065 [Polyangiaceae bacterium]